MKCKWIQKIQNGKLFVNGVFKRELTAAEMDEVERWSESFNQLFTHVSCFVRKILKGKFP